MEYDKKFIIVGNQNAITLQRDFPLIKDNKMWLGYGFPGGADILSTYITLIMQLQIATKTETIRVSGVVWYTNLDIKSITRIWFYKHYTPEEFPKYDNYDAINVDKTADIPFATING